MQRVSTLHRKLASIIRWSFPAVTHCVFNIV